MRQPRRSSDAHGSEPRQGSPTDTDAPPSGAHLPRAPRFDMRTDAEIGVGGSASRAQVLNVSEAGAFVAVNGECRDVTGEVLRLTFKLPGGPELRVTGRVRWCRGRPNEDGPAGYGVEFAELDERQREVLAAYAATRRDTPTRLSAGVANAYRVSAGPRQIRIELDGYLNPQESRTLAGDVRRGVESMVDRPVLAHIDARRFRPCPESSLPILRETFRSLGRCGPILGVLLGPRSVGMLQLKRLAREAGVGNALAAFEDEQEASSFWRQLEEQIWGEATQA